MITEVIQATELSQWMEKQKNVKKEYIYIYICVSITIGNKSVILIVHNSQRQTKKYIGTLLTY